MTAPCLPSELPDLRLSMLDRWDTPGWQNAATEASVRGETFVYGRMMDRAETEARAANYISWEKRLLRNADLYWVGGEMCELLYHASRTVPEDVMVANLTIPSDAGFVVFERPWIGLDAYGGREELEIDAIGWAWSNLPSDETHPDGMMCLSVSMYCQHDFTEGLKGKELQWATVTGAVAEGRRGRLGPLGGDRVGWSLTGRAWSPAGRSDWPIDAELGTGSPFEPEAFTASAMEDRRLIAALFTLLTAHVADVREERPDRPTRRRTERKHAKPGTVKLVYLRRPERDVDEPDEGHDGRRVNWSHRWMVGAHIRNQPCGPGRRERRLVLIAPYVKGPEDKPLVVKESVKVWVR